MSVSERPAASGERAFLAELLLPLRRDVLPMRNPPYIIMKQLRLRDALANDEHFREAGLNALLT